MGESMLLFRVAQTREKTEQEREKDREREGEREGENKWKMTTRKYTKRGYGFWWLKGRNTVGEVEVEMCGKVGHMK